MLTPDHHRRIAEAVADAELRTSGEIACVLTREVSAYPETTLAWAAGAALVLPPLALWLGLNPETLEALRGGWRIAHPGGVETAAAAVLGGYALVQAAVFALVAALLTFLPALRRALTPPWVKQRRVRRAAMEHFLSMGVHQDEARTGVLIFAALAEHQVEVVADRIIHEKVGQETWNAAAGAVVEGMRADDPASGFVRAIEICGGALAQHFPSSGPRTNALPDRLVEL